MYYRTQSAIWPIRLYKYSPKLKVLYDPFDYTSTVQLSNTDIPLTEKKKLKDEHLSTFLRFFNLPLEKGPNDRGLPF